MGSGLHRGPGGSDDRAIPEDVALLFEPLDETAALRALTVDELVLVGFRPSRSVAGQPDGTSV